MGPLDQVPTFAHIYLCQLSYTYPVADHSCIHTLLPLCLCQDVVAKMPFSPQLGNLVY